MMFVDEFGIMPLSGVPQSIEQVMSMLGAAPFVWHRRAVTSRFAPTGRMYVAHMSHTSSSHVRQIRALEFFAPTAVSTILSLLAIPINTFVAIAGAVITAVNGIQQIANFIRFEHREITNNQDKFVMVDGVVGQWFAVGQRRTFRTYRGSMGWSVPGAPSSNITHSQFYAGHAWIVNRGMELFFRDRGWW
ncbi:MAG: hypothetical protein FWE21_03035 [Defluviitaleaceae bacterium]|nr:hypothetical protein [Defluviitaleaceae bacterium]